MISFCFQRLSSTSFYFSCPSPRSMWSHSPISFIRHIFFVSIQLLRNALSSFTEGLCSCLLVFIFLQSFFLPQRVFSPTACRILVFILSLHVYSLLFCLRSHVAAISGFLSAPSFCLVCVLYLRPLFSGLIHSVLVCFSSRGLRDSIWYLPRCGYLLRAPPQTPLHLSPINFWLCGRSFL